MVAFDDEVGRCLVSFAHDRWDCSGNIDGQGTGDGTLQRPRRLHDEDGCRGG